MPPSDSFHSPWAFALLAAVPLVLLWAFWEVRSRAVLRFSAAHAFARRGRGIRPYLLPLLPMMRVAGIALAIVAIARPQTRDNRTRDLSVEGIDIVIAFDLSTSMEAADFRPQNRLYVARQVLLEFLDTRVNDRIGLVVFAGEAVTQAPLTLDYEVLREVIRQIRTRVLPDGTAIGDAVAVSLNRLRDSEAQSRVVLLITDGDNNAGKIAPLDAAAMAKALDIRIYTILVGKGGKVPFPMGRDLFGNVAYRDMELPVNPKLLEEMSAMTGGESYVATDRAELEKGLRAVLDSLERSKLMEGGAAADYAEDYHPFLLWAFFLLASEFLLRRSVLRVFP
jgi:Ca-activated chloride channel family protein